MYWPWPLSSVLALECSTDSICCLAVFHLISPLPYLWLLSSVTGATFFLSILSWTFFTSLPYLLSISHLVLDSDVSFCLMDEDLGVWYSSYVLRLPSAAGSFLPLLLAFSACHRVPLTGFLLPFSYVRCGFPLNRCSGVILVLWLPGYHCCSAWSLWIFLLDVTFCWHAAKKMEVAE